MRRTIRFILMGVISACTIGRSTIGSSAIMPAPTSFSATSEFGGPFVAASLFDATVSDADVGTTVYGVSDNQWAGVGPGPHQVYMDFGTPVTANGLAYAQRAGAIGGNNDKVGKIELWFSNSDFGGTLPATPPDAVVTPSVPSPNTGLLLGYSLGGLRSGRYVAASFSALDVTIPPNVNNIGGSELRLTIPEPGSLLLTMLGSIIGCAMIRSKRSAR
jgi:hypothetical protein